MNIKTFIAAAVVALTSACTQAEQAEQTEVIEVPVEVELNDDGSVKTEATDAADAGSAVAPVGQQHQL